MPWSVPVLTSEDRAGIYDTGMYEDFHQDFILCLGTKLLSCLLGLEGSTVSEHITTLGKESLYPTFYIVVHTASEL